MEEALTNEFLCLMMATGYALLGRRDDTLRMLRAAVDLGFINHRGIVTNSAFRERYTEDPDFQALLAEIEPRWRSVVAWDRGLADGGGTLTAPRPGS